MYLHEEARHHGDGRKTFVFAAARQIGEFAALLPIGLLVRAFASSGQFSVGASSCGRRIAAQAQT
jgi:hypothetical protein